MSKILEEILMQKDECVATVYLIFLNKKIKLAEKITKNAFKTVDIKFFDEIDKFCYEEDISGYTVYDILSSTKDAISGGNYNKLYTYIEKFNLLEEKAFKDIKSFESQKNT